VAAGKHVLLVDDDAAIAELYRLGLEAEGLRVTVIGDAMYLNDRVAAEHPDIVVLDWDLPGVRGDEALERLRRTSKGRSLPVLMFSNFPGTKNGAIDRAFAWGAIAWLQKLNTTPSQLASKLFEVLAVVDPEPI
jgi:two-component system, OmpR family, phosphate regulon response regulator PhoB